MLEMVDQSLDYKYNILILSLIQYAVVTTITHIMVVSNIFRGFVRGAKRGVMTSKRGNSQFYKGRGTRGTGRHTRKGGFIVNHQYRIPEIIVPNLEGFELKPYVTYRAPYVEGKPMTAQDILDLVQPTDLTELPDNKDS